MKKKEIKQAISYIKNLKDPAARRPILESLYLNFIYYVSRHKNAPKSLGNKALLIVKLHEQFKFSQIMGNQSFTKLIHSIFSEEKINEEEHEPQRSTNQEKLMINVIKLGIDGMLPKFFTIYTLISILEIDSILNNKSKRKFNRAETQEVLKDLQSMEIIELARKSKGACPNIYTQKQ